MSAQAELPLRPMTLGELLDAAMALLRRRALPLFCASAVLAALEQVVLAPLRTWADLSPPYFGPAENHFGAWWLVTSLGFGSEIFIITLLGAVAAAAAGPALLGRAVRDRELWRRTRPLFTIATAITLGALGVLGALLGFVPWLLVLGFFGLSAPALVIDHSGNALGRSAGLSVRSGMRGFWILIVGYLTWFAIRFALGAGWTELASLVTGADPEFAWWLAPISWALADTVAYASLACLGAVLLLDVRVRTEGLDIAINRTRSRGGDDAAPLVHRS